MQILHNITTQMADYLCWNTAMMAQFARYSNYNEIMDRLMHKDDPVSRFMFHVIENTQDNRSPLNHSNAVFTVKSPAK